jgi:hypothetical protein
VTRAAAVLALASALLFALAPAVRIAYYVAWAVGIPALLWLWWWMRNYAGTWR